MIPNQNIPVIEHYDIEIIKYGYSWKILANVAIGRMTMATFPVYSVAMTNIMTLL